MYTPLNLHPENPDATGPTGSPLPPVQTDDVFNGDSGNNSFTGTSGDDTFNMADGGQDKVLGEDGDDVANFGNTFGVGDTYHGYDGLDTLNIAGSSYAAGLSISESMLSGVEDVELGDGYNYNLTFLFGSAHNVARMDIDGSKLSATHHITIDASALSNNIQINGGLGDDTITGGKGDDWLYSGPTSNDGGKDTIDGGPGNDLIIFTNDFTGADHVDGGGGDDALILDGTTYAGGLTLTSAMIKNIAEIDLGEDADYKIIAHDGIVTPGTQMTIRCDSTTSTNHTYFDGSAETGGSFQFLDTPGNDTFLGGSGNDFFNITRGGSDTLHGNGGDDIFAFGTSTFNSNDHVDGGAGNDTVRLYGMETSNITLNSALLNNIERLEVDDQGEYHFTTADNLVGAGDTFTFDATFHTSEGALSFSGSAETNGKFHLIGSQLGDTLTGGHGDDVIQGNAGADTLTGGQGKDIFDYGLATESSGLGFDTIVGFNAHSDKFDTLNTVSHVATEITHGKLDQATFDADIANAVNASLGAHDAVLFKPASGTYKHDTFLIVDQDGHAGYSDGFDLVIMLKDGSNLADLAASNFT